MCICLSVSVRVFACGCIWVCVGVLRVYFVFGYVCVNSIDHHKMCICVYVGVRDFACVFICACVEF